MGRTLTVRILLTVPGWRRPCGSSRRISSAAPTPTCCVSRCVEAAGDPGVDLYLKDESTHVTGSLKHRLGRSLFLYSLCNGWLSRPTTVIESSSGSTAVSEAYFARMIGLPFVAVMPASTSREKIALIEAQGGRCHLVSDPGTIYAESRRLAHECGGHYMDQFTHAERATDWRGNNNIAESIFAQLSLERHPVPEWIVIGAGTGGTSATIGRFVRYRGHSTRLCVPDPDGSAFFGAWRDSDPGRHRGGVPDRGDRPAAGRTVLRRAGDRPDGQGARRGLGRRDARGGEHARPPGWTVDRAPTCGRRSG